jgi:protein phosphatase
VHDRSEDTAVKPSVDEFAESFFAPSARSLRIGFGAASDVGHKRAQNEDHFAVFGFRRSAELLLGSLAAEDMALPATSSYAMVVADGMGGMKSGEMASRLALQTMVELAGHATSWVMKLTDLDAQQIEQRAEAYVKRVHATLRRHGRSDPALENMGTTWTSAHLLGRDAVIVHLGDSRAYLFRGGQLHQITRDETMAQSLIDAGMSPKSVDRFGHILLNSLGGGNERASAKVRHVQLNADDRLLLCTDGLTDMASDQEIAAELQRGAAPQATCEALVELALDHGGKDNVTVVLASVEALDA